MKPSVVLSALLLAGCPVRDLGEDSGPGADADTAADASLDASLDAGQLDAATDAGAVDAGPRSVPKGEACERHADCAEPNARCRAGDLCTGTLDETSFQTECASGGAAACDGPSCIGLRPNAQNKTCICSLPCVADEDCGGAGACVTIAGRKMCLRPCNSSADCQNGYVCVPNPDGPGQACLVEVL